MGLVLSKDKKMIEFFWIPQIKKELFHWIKLKEFGATLNGNYEIALKKLVKKASQWECGGVPLTMMMNIERRKGKEKPVIKKALVKLDGAVFKILLKNREKWALTESYIFPGPIQYYGPSTVTDITTITLKNES